MSIIHKSFKSINKNLSYIKEIVVENFDIREPDLIIHILMRNMLKKL